ncbi:MAG: hypothetical protein Q4E65_04525 [Clostridia bacterium]|nr:hypothetical protein [Clostridia bacterium]
MLSFFLALLLLFCALLAPATTLAAPSNAASCWDFINTTTCDQFQVGVDSNSFPHSRSAFPPSYALDRAYQSALFKMATKKEYQRIVEYMQKEWGGSCYGISTTMILNRLTRMKMISPGLPASTMHSGAKNYFSIPNPKTSRSALNYINYFMLSQFVSKSRAGIETKAITTRKDGKIFYDRASLEAVVKKVVDFVDTGRPFQVGYGYGDGGHAIVGCDYYFYNDNDPAKNRDIIVLKFYDENDRGMAARYGTPHFCYVKLALKNGVIEPLAEHKDSNGNERVYLYYYNYAKKKFFGTKVLTYLAVRDTAKLYQNLRTGGAMNFLASSASSAAPPQAVLTLDDIDGYDADFRIKPFAYGAGGDVNHVDYADGCGRLFRIQGGSVDPGALIDDEDSIDTETAAYAYPAIPVDAKDTDLDFANMVVTSVSPGYRHEGYDEGEGLYMEIDLMDAGKVDRTVKTFDGYDIVTSDAFLPGVSLAKGDHYAWVGGSGIDYIRFSSDGRLRDVIAGDGAPGGSAELYFGTDGDELGLDMFRLAVQNFSILQVFDEEDGAAFADGVWLRTDGLADGFDFTFYQDELESDDYEGDIAYEDTDDVWIKIAPKRMPDGTLGVEVWAQPWYEGEDPHAFTDEDVVFRSEFHARTFPSEYGASATAYSQTDSRNEYPMKGGENGVPQPDGGLRFTIDAPHEKQTGAAVDGKPLQKDVDYESEPGSTIITLKPAFLSTLADGTHRLEVYFTDGHAQTTFTTPVGAPLSTAAVTSVPATGGAPIGTVLLLAGVLGVCLWSKKRRDA